MTEGGLRRLIRQVLRESVDEFSFNIENIGTLSPGERAELLKGYRRVKFIKAFKDLEGNQIREKTGYMIVKNKKKEEYHVLEGEGHYLENLRYCCGPFESLEVAESNVPFDNDIHYDLDSRF